MNDASRLTKTRNIAATVALLALTACAPPDHFKCVNGVTYKEWQADVWVRLDGSEYPFRKDGPLACTP